MRGKDATALYLLVSSLACGKAPRASGPPDAGTPVTVYVPAKIADRVIARLTTVAARHQWALSVRTDSAAIGEADLVIWDSAGLLIARPRPGSPAAAQAEQMAAAVRE